MEINLVEEKEIKSRRGSRAVRGIYMKYSRAIEKHIPWIKEEIENSPDKKIRIKIAELQGELGGEFLRKSETAIYSGLKYALFKEDIAVDTGTHKDGDKLLIIRFKEKDDVLPESLIKMIEKEAKNVLVDKVEEFNKEAELRERIID